jgi:uncharacterized protein YlxW (UPF0749 family)
MAETPLRPGVPEHVTTPLLALITQRSLDADYEHVAERRRKAGGEVTAHPVPRRTAAMVLLVFGLLVTIAAVQTSANAPAQDASRASLINQIDLRRQSVSEQQRTLARDQSQQLSLQNTLTALATAGFATRAKLQRLEVRTGFGAVRGPGIKATVSGALHGDATQMVRDSDLALLADALWAAGAEAISVNGQRLTVLSSFRNVGIGILINSQAVNPPYVFDVVGNPNTLPADLLSTSAGEQWYALKASLGFRFDVRDGGTMELPAASTQPLRSARILTGNDVDTRTKGGPGS